MRFCFLTVLLLVCAVGFCNGGRGKKYELGDQLQLFVNTVGPYANPSETYEYYSLPFCVPESVQLVRIRSTIGMAIEGDRLYTSLFEHHFAAPINNKVLCKKQLQREEIEKLQEAIKKQYFFEMWIDGLPLHGFIGSVQEENGKEKAYLYTNLHFNFLFNENRVIQANITSDASSVVLLDDQETVSVTFSYSSEWSATEFTVNDRNRLQRPFVQHMEVHWLSIMNSVGLVLLLTGFLSIVINRIIRKDIVRYSQSLEDGEEEEEYGWKLIHGDVFRFPEHNNLLSAFLGVGAQLLTVCFLLLILSTIGWLYPEQIGSLYSAGIFVFALASGVAGAVSAAFYKKLQGEKWARNIVLAATLFAVPVSFVSITADIFARYYHSTSALPVETAIEIFLIWAIVGLPLTLFGGIAGRRLSSPLSSPVRTKNAIREIPPVPFYRQAVFHYMLGGFLPFSAIYIELHYVYETLWGHFTYGLYGILFLVFIILLLVTACITITLTYFQLATEDHRWWWRSFCTGGFTSMYVLVYSIYYYVFVSNMSGILQIVKYCSFVAISCYFFFVMLGAVGFAASLAFVLRIYGTLKID